MSQRINFFIKHLLITICIILCISIIIYYVWYPSPLQEATQVNDIFKVFIFVDLVIGPILCFLVYNEKKESLKKDLFVIISLQVIALCFGIYKLAEVRPVWIVFNADRFELIQNNAYIDNSINFTRRPSWLGPQMIAVSPPKSKNQKNEDLFTEVFQGISIAQHGDRYTDLININEILIKNMRSIKQLEKFNSTAEVNKALRDYPTAHAWLPLKTYRKDMVILFSNNIKEYKIVSLNPW